MKIIRLFLLALLFASICTGLIPPQLVHQLITDFEQNTPLPAVTAPITHAVAGLVPQGHVAQAANLFLPYTQNFDSLAPNTTNVPAAWVQVIGDGNDMSCSDISTSLVCNNWIVDNNSTPTNNTGPTADHTGGGNYLYVEASSNSNPTVELLTPSFDLAGTTAPRLAFWVHRWDNINTGNSHELRIDVMAADGSTAIATDLLTIDNNNLDLNAWTQRTVDLTAYRNNGEIRILFRWLRNGSATNTGSPDIAIDDVSLADSATVTAGMVMGTVFRDYNANGLRDANEPGIENVVVTAVSATGVTATTTTARTGIYTFGASAGLGGNVRLEFTLPTDNSLNYLKAGAGGQSTVQFINVSAGVANVDVGFYDPVDYCQASPNLALTTFYDSQYNGAAAANSALLSLPYSASGHHFTNSNPVARTASFLGTDLTRLDQLGAIYGVAWQRTTKRLYLGAYHKRYSGFGPNGPDAIYQTDLTGAVTGVIELDTLLGIVNSAGSDVHDFAPASGVIYDIGASNASYDGVGKRAFGDLELSSDMTTLYVVNLFDRKLYALDVRSGLASAATIVQSWSAPDATGANRHRPFGLAWHAGKLWVGSVDDNGSQAYVHSLDPAGTTFVLELTVALSYTRQNWASYLNVSRPAAWQSWSSNPTTLSLPTGTEIGYPQPMLTDLEFTHDGLLLGFRDRMGDQGGGDKYFRPGASTKTWVDAAGDLLRACRVAGAYTLETGATGACANPTALEGRTNSGPGDYEYYFWDIWGNTATWNPSPYNGAFHWETTQGALVQLAGNSSVVTSAMDPMDDFSGGLLKLDNATGRREGVADSSAALSSLVGGYTTYDSIDYTYGYPTLTNHTFAKANGLGDIEALCDPAPLEIGNRVWADTDGDGVQDPGEPGLAGISVQLYAPDGITLLATAVTDAQGEYYFSSDATRTSTASRIYNLTALTYRTSGYHIRLAANQAALTGYQLSTQDSTSGANGDLRDSDGALASTTIQAVVNTGSVGTNDHTIDFGFITVGAVIGHLFVDRNGNGSQDADEPNLANITVRITDQRGVIHTLVTDSNGNYSATVATGTATVNVDESTLPSGYTQTAGSDPTVVTVTTGATTNAGNDGYRPPQADLTIKKIDLVDPLPAGAILTYTIFITNNGPSPAGNVVITDTLPADTSFVSATAGCYAIGSQVLCTFTTIAVGETKVITVRVAVDPMLGVWRPPPKGAANAGYFALAPPGLARWGPPAPKGGPPYVPL